MRVLRQATLLLVAGVILTAPMACVRFCELQRDLARPRVSLAEMARLHALSLSERKTQQPHSHSDDHAPLARLKQMVSSVTEFILMLGIAIGAAVVALRIVTPVLRLDQPVLAVPKPPPRRPMRLSPSVA
jgi:hypothetical protein